MQQRAALLLVQINNKIIDLLISPKTTLPWLIATVPGAAWLMPLLAPVREAGSMLPQWWLQKSAIGQYRRRDLGWRLGISGQLLGVLGIVLTAFFSSQKLLPFGIILSLLVMSLGRALTSVFSKDIQADIVDKEVRGRFTGLVATLSGMLSIGFALLLVFNLFKDDRLLLNMGFIAVLVSIVVALAFSYTIHTRMTSIRQAETASIMAQFENNPLLLNMVISRCLLLHAMLAIPFVSVIMGQGAQLSVGWLILASGSSALISSYLWGWMSDKQNIKTLFIASSLSLAALLIVVLFAEYLPKWTNFIVFFAILVGYDGIRVGRKTLLLNVTNDQNRLAFVGAGNTVVGVFLIVSGILYSVLYTYHKAWLLGIMITVLGSGIVHLVKLHNVIKKHENTA